VLPGTGGTVTFKYDGFGRRIQKALTQGSTTTTTNYLYDGSNSIADVDQNGNVLARYEQTANIDEPLAELRGGTTSYYQADGLGSVTSLTSSAGALGNTYTYDSFGNLTTSTGSITNRFQYTGREFDSETGIYYYRARYFDSNLGRFIGEDFLRLGDARNFYIYAINSPILYFDPYGLCPWQVRQRPLAGKLGNAVKHWDDPPPSHKYFYNTQTGQSIGLGDGNGAPWYNPGSAVPGSWLTHENPASNPDDTLTGQVPDQSCDCVDKKAKNPGPPPTYCGLGHPHLGQAPCLNCWNWVVSVLQACSEGKSQQSK